VGFQHYFHATFTSAAGTAYLFGIPAFTCLIPILFSLSRDQKIPTGIILNKRCDVGVAMKAETFFRYSKIQNIAISGTTFIRYAQCLNIRKTNKLKVKKVYLP
jgi:hypothetical protein